MRILFAVMYLAGASAVTDVGAHVEPSGSACPLPVDQCEGQTTRHLRVLESTLNNEEERGFPETADLLASGVDKRLREGFESQTDHKRLKMYIEDDTPLDELSKMLEFHETENRKQIQNEMDKKMHEVPSIQPAPSKILEAQKQDKAMAGLKVTAKQNSDKIIRLTYLRAEKDPSYLLSVIQSAEPSLNIFKNPEIPNRVLYVDDYNKKYPKKAKTLIGWLEYGCKDFVAKLYKVSKYPRRELLAKQVLDELIESWLNAKYDSADVYVRLGLRDLDFSSGQFDEWMQYVADFNHVYPQQKKSYCSILASVYTKDGLLALFKNAPKSPRTKRVALDFKDYLKHEAAAVNNIPHRIEALKFLQQLRDVMVKLPRIPSTSKLPRALHDPPTMKIYYVNEHVTRVEILRH